MVNSGNWLSKDGTDFEIGNGSNGNGTSIWKAYKGLRIVNRVIRDIDLVPGLSEGQRNELLGQSHFLRAWFYFQLIKRNGGMPIFDQLFVGDGDEDLPRKTYHESHAWMMTDIEKAISMLPDVCKEALSNKKYQYIRLSTSNDFPFPDDSLCILILH